MKLSDFDYDLPEELIAQSPTTERDHSRLLVVEKIEEGVQSIIHEHFYDLIKHIKEGDVLVVNETKVIPAKICGKKDTGAPMEVIILHPVKRKSENEYVCMIKGHRPRVNGKLVFPEGIEADITDSEGDFWHIRLNEDIGAVMEKIGELPLPPYVKSKLEDETKYQTSFSEKEGSLAAPTAGLHFTPGLLAAIEEKGATIAKVCLHIGMGTFLPIKQEDLSKHEMEPEYFEVSQETANTINNRKGRLITVGTTSFKTLESASDKEGMIHAKRGWSSTFIHPDYKLKVRVDALLTNFHLPRSTLICLVSAFWGRESILSIYREAVQKRYRFFSFGDAMLLVKK